MDGDHVQTVVQVFAKLALIDELPQVALAAGDNPHVDGNLPCSAQALDCPGLDDPKQLDLHRHRHIVHVVQEDRAAVGQLEAAWPIVDGAGKRSAFVAEQL